MKRLTFFVVSSLLSSSSLANDWFPETPLKASYSALVEGNTLLAWQELQLSLSRHNVEERYWRPVKQAILSETQCGRHLTSTASIAANISLTIISKGNANNQGYQVKLSTEQITQPLELQLFDEYNTLIVSATVTSPTKEYHEFESDELLSEPKAGLYQLAVNGIHYPLIISSFTTTPWLHSTAARAFKSLTITPPNQIASCAPASVRWQWFDEDYNLLERPSPMNLTPAITDNNDSYSVSLPPAAPAKAYWLSGVVSQFEYQGRIKVEYIQRFILPTSVIETYR
ncbi:DUF2861 family protein [Photobacterium chitinilyticum]|uniref:DUF2861 family protein n=1 Tax=Photobacterium chitinilyticum TaxID=2485123 RepID=UPI003D1363D9